MHPSDSRIGFPRFAPAAALPLLLALLAAGCSRPASDSPSASAPFHREGNVVVVPEGSPLRARLVTETVQTAEGRKTHTLPGVIEADSTKFTRVFAPVTGRVVTLHVQLGEQVREGQLLATLHAPDFMQAQGDFLKARSALLNATRKLSRQQDLLAHKIAAETDVEDAVANRDAAQSDFDSAAARLRAYSFDPDKDAFGRPLQLIAPVAGKVIEVAAALGEFRNDNTQPLLTVADLTTVWLTASVPEKDLRFLRAGEQVEATLGAYPGDKFAGTVLTIGDVLDPDTRIAKMRVALPNREGRLKPGMFANVTLLDFPETQISVPSAAVVQVGTGAYIYEQVRPWAFEPKAVTLGQSHDGRTVIAAGLAAGAVILARDGVLFQ